MNKTITYFCASVLILALFGSGCKKEEKAKPIINSFKLNAGDTLGASLQNSNLPKEENEKIIANLSKVFNPRYCKAGDSYSIEVDTANNWLRFIYMPSGLEFYVIQKSSTGAVDSLKKTKSTKKNTYTGIGAIKTSLWESMRSKGLEPELIISYAEVFSWQIDFLTEPRVGDIYKLTWDRVESQDGTIVSDTITGAQYIAKDKTYTAILYLYPDGKSDYYNIKGESLRRAFLKAPLQYRRISSFFSNRRFHPILKIVRPHLGIDYAAPSGTPVSAIGDGRLAFKGWQGGFGNLLRIHHTNGYESMYGHLLGFAKGLKTGDPVRQGQVVGYVGATGLASGPHLDFRMKKDGSFLNFLKMKLPVVKNIEKANKDDFASVARNTLSSLAKIH